MTPPAVILFVFFLSLIRTRLAVNKKYSKKIERRAAELSYKLTSLVITTRKRSNVYVCGFNCVKFSSSVSSNLKSQQNNSSAYRRRFFQSFSFLLNLSNFKYAHSVFDSSCPCMWIISTPHHRFPFSHYYIHKSDASRVRYSQSMSVCCA